MMLSKKVSLKEKKKSLELFSTARNSYGSLNFISLSVAAKISMWIIEQLTSIDKTDKLSMDIEQ